MLRPPWPGRHTLPLLATAAVLSLCVASSAGATAAIEGVWSFNGGQIAVHRLTNGTYAGTVVAETRFAACSHPVGQQIWTSMNEQPDGSYWGLHQWYRADCEINPELGPTAWRILEGTKGSRYMRVCFSNPGTSQPKIAPSGAPKEESEFLAYNVTYGCYNSALIAPLPVAPGTSSTSGAPGSGGSASGALEILKLPGAKRCVRVTQLKIRLRDPKYDPLKTVTIVVAGRKLKSSRRGSFIVATIKLSNLPKSALAKGSFTIKVRAITVLGHILSSKRTYHLCHHHKAHKKQRRKG